MTVTREYTWICVDDKVRYANGISLYKPEFEDIQSLLSTEGLAPYDLEIVADFELRLFKWRCKVVIMGVLATSFDDKGIVKRIRFSSERIK